MVQKQPTYINLYAELCQKIVENYLEEQEGKGFENLFQEMLVEDILSTFTKAEMEVTARNKVEMLNISHFIGSLVKQKVMDKKYVKSCIQELFSSMMNRFYE